MEHISEIVTKNINDLRTKIGFFEEKSDLVLSGSISTIYIFSQNLKSHFEVNVPSTVENQLEVLRLIRSVYEDIYINMQLQKATKQQEC